MAQLERVTLSGFRSIQSAEIEIRPINVLIGANGAGKSNLVSFFQMLNFAIGSRAGLAEYVGRSGGGSRLLHFGPKRTGSIAAQLRFRTPGGINGYRFTLAPADEDTLIYTSERVSYEAPGHTKPLDVTLGVGHSGSELSRRPTELQTTERLVQHFLRASRVFHFHDTSSEGPLRQRWSIDETQYLRANGANLAAYLHHLRDYTHDAYERITQTLQTLLPWFEDFALEPEEQTLILRCLVRGQPDYPLSVRQISDGSLRLMALITLLRQPVERRPQFIILDEPELGLHPAGEAAVARLIRAASEEGSQVLIATQSATFLSHFEPEDIVVVENEDGASTFQRHTREELAGWLERYSLGQIWMKNLIGGRP